MTCRILSFATISVFETGVMIEDVAEPNLVLTRMLLELILGTMHPKRNNINNFNAISISYLLKCASKWNECKPFS